MKTSRATRNLAIHLYPISVGLFLFGIATFLGGIFVLHNCPSSVCLPLGELNSVAVDREGRVYCASGFYSRVQAYSAQGEFLRGWPIPHMRYFWIRTNRSDEIEVRNSRGWLIYTCSLRGELLKKHPLPPERDSRIVPPPEDASLECRDLSGNTYLVRFRYIYPYVVRRAKDGKLTTAVPPPRLSWFIMGPFPAVAYSFLGVLLLLLANKARRASAGP